MQTHMLTLGAMLIATIWAWVGLVAPPALAQRARVPQTGQTQCWDATGSPIRCGGTGQDGDIQAGVDWPTPRFQYNRNGTVTDKLTGLIWLMNASCFGSQLWANALTVANTLASGNCGLADRSQVGDWRLPNIRELYSLFDLGFFEPALSNEDGTARWTEGHAFSGVQPVFSYWSSTTVAQSPSSAWYVYPGTGSVLAEQKSIGILFVWPVRGGE